MKAIETRYLPATARKGSRIVASDSDGNRATISYPHPSEGESAHHAAAVALCAKMHWSGDLIGAQTKHGFAFMFAPEVTKPDTRYNGWTSYETWAVNLWMDNDEGSQSYWNERAGEAYEGAEASEVLTKAEDATNTLADWIKSEHEETLPELTGFAVDLLNGAMSEVCWYEIAENLINNVVKELEVA